ncbi:cytochrome c-554 [Haloferula helveola]|uniref:Cytochrome c-554 n=1 Tax=Haloferula helveola TaxID=490095 RepID=A0ABM7REH1_9BACT|nr:cytochrome c-554 [Haloferula helveola]
MRRLLFLAALVFASCEKKPVEVGEQSLTVHFTCDTFGRLEPCGCFTGQHGGMTRLRTWLQGQDRDGPSLRLDVGGALAGSHDYDRIQYAYLLRAYSAMGYRALNIGGREAEVTADQLKAMTAGSPVPIISASLIDASTREPLLDPYVIVEDGGRKIGILGLIDPASCPDPGKGLAILDMPAAVDRVLPDLKEKSDVIIVLAFTGNPGMEQLARSYFEFDMILGGDVRQPAQYLETVNESVIAYTTNEGRTVATMKATISAGERPRLVDPSYKVELLHEKIPQDPEFRQMVKEYREEIRETELDVDRPGENGSSDAIPGVTAAATYVGSESCQACHQDEHAVWAKSGHAHAFETLVKLGAESDPHCIKCHTVGFGEESGYRREYGANKLTGVGCESCHGPASEHVSEMTSGRPKRFKFRPLGAADCTGCHYGEFSRPFDWEKFWPHVRHGDDGP